MSELYMIFAPKKYFFQNLFEKIEYSSKVNDFEIGNLKLKFDDCGSRGRSVCTSVPNLPKISQRVTELWRFLF